MESVFLKVLNMSLTAGYAVIFVLVVRQLFKKAPKIFSYALWSVVLFRLLCPFSFESLFSLVFINANSMPVNSIYSNITPINTGINLADSATSPILLTQSALPGASASSMPTWAFTGSMIWMAGIADFIGGRSVVCQCRCCQGGSEFG